MPGPAPELRRPATTTELFTGFTALALQGFGGVIAVAQRFLCEERRWISREQFVELLAVGQVLPGPNVVNIALMVGDRFFGWRGAFAALAGIMLVPLAIVLVLVGLYVHFQQLPWVAGALRGMGAVAAGMIAGTALKLAPALRLNPMGTAACAGFALAAFAAVSLARWPLVWVLLGIGAVACGFAAWRLTGKART
jgi:chromate transporter